LFLAYCAIAIPYYYVKKIYFKTKGLKKSAINLSVKLQKANTRREIEKARLIAEDESKSAQERLENLQKAL